MIVGIIATFALLSGGLAGSHSTITEEAQRLARLIELHCEEAVLWGREAGVRLEPGGYAFLWWDGEDWSPPQVPQLRPHQLPAGVELVLDSTTALPGDPALPQLVCWSSGELTPFRALFHAGSGPRYAIQGFADGRVETPGWRDDHAG